MVFMRSLVFGLLFLFAVGNSLFAQAVDKKLSEEIKLSWDGSSWQSKIIGQNSKYIYAFFESGNRKQTILKAFDVNSLKEIYSIYLVPTFEGDESFDFQKVYEIQGYVNGEVIYMLYPYIDNSIQKYYVQSFNSELTEIGKTTKVGEYKVAPYTFGLYIHAFLNPEISSDLILAKNIEHKKDEGDGIEFIVIKQNLTFKKTKEINVGIAPPYYGFFDTGVSPTEGSLVYHRRGSPFYLGKDNLVYFKDWRFDSDSKGFYHEFIYEFSVINLETGSILKKKILEDKMALSLNYEIFADSIIVFGTYRNKYGKKPHEVGFYSVVLNKTDFTEVSTRTTIAPLEVQSNLGSVNFHKVYVHVNDAFFDKDGGNVFFLNVSDNPRSGNSYKHAAIIALKIDAAGNLLWIRKEKLRIAKHNLTWRQDFRIEKLADSYVLTHPSKYQSPLQYWKFIERINITEISSFDGKARSYDVYLFEDEFQLATKCSIFKLDIISEGNSLYFLYNEGGTAAVHVAGKEKYVGKISIK
jgi:hypothetical protein